MSFGIPVRNGFGLGLKASTTLSTRSGSGTPTAALSINFLTSTSLPASITFTRGSTATYTGSNGYLQSAAINTARFDYDPVTLAPRGLLIEEQRTNLLTYSEQFDNAVWTKTNAAITPDAVVSPDGTANADTLVEDTSNAQHFMRRTLTLTAAAYTWSVYAKQGPGSKRWLSLYPQGSGVGAVAIFDLTLGTVTSTGLAQFLSANITPADNGWYRCSISFTAAAVSVVLVSYLSDGFTLSSPIYAGNGVSGIYLYGEQLEAGAFATSYIPTVASTVTRSADVATMTGTNFSSWYNQTAGTFVAEADSVVPTTYAGTGVVVSAASAGVTEYVRILQYLGRWGGNVYAAGTTQANLLQTASYAANTPAKSAFAFAANDFAFSASGATPITDTSGVVGAASQLIIGAGTTSGGAPINGHIRTITYYNTRVSNTQLQALST